MTGLEQEVNQKTFNEVKNALRKTIHTLIDLDFEDGKLDEAIKSFLDAEKMQINLTFHLHPNDVIFVRNLKNEKVPRKVLDRVKRLRRGEG
jgi:flagellar biosynthesis/type III secretory pathway protein FliH